MDDRPRWADEEVKEVRFSDVRGRKDVILLQSRHSFDPRQSESEPGNGDLGRIRVYGSAMRCMNDFCFPDFGGVSATDSIEGVTVTVNRHVCRSFGRLLKRYESSSVNVGVRSLSASSRTWEPIASLQCSVFSNNSSQYT